MIRKLLFGIGIALAVGANIAANGTSQADAVALITIVGLMLPFLLKYVPAAGHQMVAITVGASLLAAVGAELLSGEIVLNDLPKADVPTLLASFMSVYGLSQLLYSILLQSEKTAVAVTEPVPAPAPPAPGA